MKEIIFKFLRSCLAILLSMSLISSCPETLDQSPFGLGEVEADFKDWTLELINLYEANPKIPELPHDLKPVSMRQQHRLESHFYRTGDVILQELVNLQKEVDSGSAAPGGLTPRNVFKRIQDSISSKRIRDRFTQQAAEREFRKQSKTMQESLEKMGSADISFPEVQRDVNRFFDAVGKIKSEFGGEFLPESAVNKAGFDVFAMTMLAKLTGGKVPSEKAAHSLALLHPVTDSYLDGMTKQRAPEVKQAMGKITQWLSGKKVVPETQYERLVIRLLENMESDFPMAEHPILWKTMALLQKSQLNSVAFQSGKVESTNALAYNTFEKGGLTYLVFAYLALGKMSRGQGEYFYKSGGMLQLVDDMLDLRADYAEKHHTLWTEGYRRTGNVKEPLFRMFQIQRYLQENTGKLTGYGEASSFERAFDSAFKLFLLSAMFDPFIFRALKGSLNKYAPTTKWGMESIVYGMLERLGNNPGEVSRFLHVMDKGFLNGRFFEQGLRGELRIRDAFIHIPAWLNMRFGHLLHSGYVRFVHPKTEFGRQMQPLLILLGGSAWLYGVHHNLAAVGPQFSALTIPLLAGVWSAAKNRPNWVAPILIAVLAGAMMANYATDDDISVEEE